MATPFAPWKIQIAYLNSRTLKSLSRCESKKTPYLYRQLQEILIDFQTSFTARLSTKFATNDHFTSHRTLKALLHYNLKPSCFSYWQVPFCCCHAFSRCFHFSSVSSAVYQACLSSSFSERILLITLVNCNLQTSVIFLSVLCHHHWRACSFVVLKHLS